MPELEEIAASQNVTFKPGDILFLRTGFLNALRALSPSDSATYAAVEPPPKAIGLLSCEETLRWIWDHGFSAVAGDQPAFESLPFQGGNYCLHEWLLAGWGMPIGELFDLERLAAECREKKKWSFFFTSVPLKVPGGVASPPNGMAIL